MQAGEVIGVIGDSRPAPHLHFEVKVVNGDTPGPGYAWEEPYGAGWLSPSKFVANMQTWLHRAHLWHIQTGENLAGDVNLVSPPLVLNDNSLLYFDDDTIKRATQDGRVLWRIGLERQPVSITGLLGIPIITYADGTVQEVTIDGALGEAWSLNESFAGAPLTIGQWLVFPTTDNRLVAVDDTRRNIVWEVANIPPFRRWHVVGGESNFLIALITEMDELLTISQTDGVVDRALLRASGSFATGATGDLLAYTQGGLWQITPDGVWSVVMDDAPPSQGSGAVLVTPDNQLYLFDGATLHAYDDERTLLWEAELQGVSGLVDLAQYGNVLLHTSTGGNVMAVRTVGGICNRTQLYGNDSPLLWHELGDDNTLRFAVADQILGLDWATFLGSCAS